MGCSIDIVGKLIGAVALFAFSIFTIALFSQGEPGAAVFCIIVMILVWFFMNIGETRRRMKNRKVVAEFSRSAVAVGVKRIKITRKKTMLVARWLTYICIIGYDVEEFREGLNQHGYALSEDAMKNINYSSSRYSSTYKNMPQPFQIDNFKAHLNSMGLADKVKIVLLDSSDVKILDLGTQSTKIFVASFGSSGAALSNQISIGEGSGKKSFIIETKSKLRTGAVVSIREEC